MSLAVVNKISKDYAGKEILREVSLSIEKYQRIGLIGRNGTGKSTLLKILAGIEDHSQGQVYTGNCTVGYLEQDPAFTPDATLYGEMLRIFSHPLRIAETMRHLETRLASPEVAKDPSSLSKYLGQYGKLQEEFERAGGYSYESQIRTVLFGLQFTEADLLRPLTTFSGGERIRAAFARLLLHRPDLLLLDEPTNHLDLPAIEWVEDYLQSYHGAIVVVSHDRVFLDRVVNRIFELEGHRIYLYHGNYSAYLAEKKKQEELQLRSYRHQQAKVGQLEQNIARFKSGTRASQAKSWEKQLAKMERVEAPKKPQKTMHLAFAPLREPGRVVLQCLRLSKTFGDRVIFRNLNLTVERGDRIVITGPNGSGKSTLLSILAGRQSPDEGEILFDPGVESGYFSQHFDDLNPDLTIYENIYRVRRMDRFQLRSLLGLFLFSGDDADKVVGALSGGEKNRVALASLIARQPNLLLLDEPTNHLDLASRDVLVKALKRFTGTIIVISHDRYLVQELATRRMAFPLTE